MSFRLPFRPRLIGGALLILALGASPAPAATAIWTGSANDGLWSSPGNWSGGTLPAPGDDLYFHLTADAVMTNDLPGGRVYGDLTMDRLGGGNNLNVTVAGNGFTVGTVTIGPPMQVHLSCPFGGSGAVLAMTVYGQLTLDAPLSGQDVTIAHIGETVLGAAPTLTGTLTVSQGTLSVTGGITSTVPLVLAGGMASRSGDNHWNGPITVSGRPYIAVDDVPAGVGRLTLGGALSGSGGLGKSGAGVLVLAGVNGMTGPGAVQVDAGTVVAGIAEAFPAGCSLVLAGGAVDLAGFTTTVASISGGGGQYPSDHDGILALNGATLILAGDQPTSGFWNGTLTGPGQVHMTGNGWWEQNGIVEVPVLIDAGELDGIGSFAAPVRIGAATVSPGSDEWQVDPGTLTFAGGLTLTDASTVIMDVGSGAADHIVVNGPAVLAGTLVIRPLVSGIPSLATAGPAWSATAALSTSATLFSFSQPPMGRINLGAQPGGYGCILQRDPVSNELTVSVAPAPAVNVAPVASDGVVQATAGVSVRAWLWAGDANGDAVTYRTIDHSDNVRIDAVDATAGTVDFTAWDPGADTWISYAASDGSLASSPAVITVEVAAPAASGDGSGGSSRCGGGIFAALLTLVMGFGLRRLVSPAR